MKFDGVNKTYFPTYMEAFKHLPTAWSRIRRDEYTAKDEYCYEVFIGWWVNLFSAVGFLLGIVLSFPIWWFCFWILIIYVLFHPDFRLGDHETP